MESRTASTSTDESVCKSAITHDQRSSALSDGWIALALGLSGFLFLLPLLRRYTMDVDEGIVLQGAIRILRHQVPYRDFFAFYTPGSYYWIAALFRVFGENAVVSRVPLLIFGAIFASVTYLLSRRIADRQTAVSAAYCVIVASLPIRFFAIHNWDSTATAVLSLYCAIRWLESNRNGWIACSGFLCGLTAMVEQSKGAGLALGLLVGLVLVRWRRDGTVWSAAHTLFCAFAALPAVTTVVYFASQGALSEAITGVLWPLHHYGNANGLPFGNLNRSKELLAEAAASGLMFRTVTVSFLFLVSLYSAMPLVILLFGSVYVLRSTAEMRVKEFVLLGTSVLAGLLLSLVLTHRPDFHHIVFIAPLFLYLLPILSDTHLRLRVVANKQALIFCSCLAATALGLAVLASTLGVNARTDTVRGEIRTMAPDELLNYFRAHVGSEPSVLVHPYRPLQTFFLGAASIGRYDFLQAGMHSREQFVEQLKSIELNPPRYALLDTNFYMVVPIAWPNTALTDIVYDPIADYIVAHYHYCRTLRSAARSFAFLARRDVPCPAD